MENHYIPSDELVKIAIDESHKILGQYAEEYENNSDNFDELRGHPERVQQVVSRIRESISNGFTIEVIDGTRKRLEDTVSGVIEIFAFENAFLGRGDYQLMNSNGKFSKELYNMIADGIPVNDKEIVMDPLQEEFFEYAKKENGNPFEKYGIIIVNENGVSINFSAQYLERCSRPLPDRVGRARVIEVNGKSVKI